MKFSITGRTISLTEGLKNMVEKKLGKLDKFFQADTPCNVTLSTQMFWKDRFESTRISW